MTTLLLCTSHTVDSGRYTDTNQSSKTPKLPLKIDIAVWPHVIEEVKLAVIGTDIQNSGNAQVLESAVQLPSDHDLSVLGLLTTPYGFLWF